MPWLTDLIYNKLEDEACNSDQCNCGIQTLSERIGKKADCESDEKRRKSEQVRGRGSSSRDRAKNIGIGGRARSGVVSGRRVGDGTVTRQRDVKLLALVAMTCFPTCEVQLPRLSYVEQRVAIIHVQYGIFQVAPLVRLWCHLNHWILTWWVQEQERIPNSENVIIGPFGVDIWISGSWDAPWIQIPNIVLISMA